ncbi:hypothetical protein ACWCYY_06685 [Kitasatospora sp. NPDC001664]
MEQGFELLPPEEVAALGRAALLRSARQVAELLALVYRRQPGEDALAAEARQLAEDAVAGRVRLFLLLDGRGEVMATTRYTLVEPLFEDGPVRYELGRTGKRPGARPGLAAALLDARVPWAREHLPEADHLVTHTRVALNRPGRPPVGPVIGSQLAQGFTATHAVHSHIVARTAAEPFVATFAPRDPTSWRASARQHPLRLPDGPDYGLLAAMWTETTGVGAAPLPPAGCGTSAGATSAAATEAAATGAAVTGAASGLVTLHQLAAPSATVESLHLLSARPPRGGRPVPEVPARVGPDGAYASTGLSDRVVVEDDVLGAPDAALHLDRLHRSGFRPAGWAPSHQRAGRPALVLTRPGSLPGPETSVTPADLRAFARLPSTGSFLAHVLSHRPS